MSDPTGGIEAELADRYAFEDEIGRGGMAVVYAARDLKHDRRVAIKVLRADVGEAVGPQRFLREIQIAAQLQHPHIVPLYDSGAVGQRLYCVMPLVEGESLRDRLRREGALPLEQALGIVRDVVEALSYSHSRGIVHRDIKPENILLAGDRALVADYGIARAIATAPEDQLTATGVAIGTPAYMSPEQGGGSSRVDGRTDIYALGCVLFEMLAGEPPFSGPTAQAIIAKHMQERVPSLAVVRPMTPYGVAKVIERALAKIPADRFSTVKELVAALDRAEDTQPTELALATRRRARRLMATTGVAVLVVLGIVLARAILSTAAPPLDGSKVVVFPLIDQRPGNDDGRAGQEVALLIGAAFEETDPLRWVYGWTWMDATERADVTALAVDRAAAIARERGAGHFVDGWIVGDRSESTVILRLHDVLGDSVTTQVSSAGALDSVSLTTLGLRAVVKLLPTLLEPGRRPEPSTLAHRSPGAITNWLQGDWEYRRSQWGPALDHFDRALATDSSFALAALHGALAAGWADKPDAASHLVTRALRYEPSLAAKYRVFARGLRAYLAGEADSAAVLLARATALDPEWPDAWMMYGEVFTHLIPTAVLDSLAHERMPHRLTVPVDSIAEAAFVAARRADPDFTPALIHLVESALVHGEIDSARVWTDRFRTVNPDTTTALQLQLMVTCVRLGAAHTPWREAAAANPRAVLWAAKSLSVAASQVECATSGFQAVLAAVASPAQDWDALMGLQHLLMAEGRTHEVRLLLDSAIADGMDAARGLFVMDALVSSDFADAARDVIAGFGSDYEARGAPTLWLIASWLSHTGAVAELGTIADVLEARAQHTDNRLDRLLAQSVRARWELVRGDSAAALARLQALRPSGSRTSLSWSLWEPLAEERLMLAELLLARGAYADAHRVASTFDYPQPAVYLLFLPQSLALRQRAAAALGSTALADVSQRRLLSLGRRDLMYH